MKRVEATFRRFEILVRYPEERRSTPEQIGDILVAAPDGLRVPLSDLAQIEEVVGPRQITRQNSQRFITIQCNVTDRDIVSFVEEAQDAIDAGVNLPTGYLVTWGGAVSASTRGKQAACHCCAHHVASHLHSAL